MSRLALFLVCVTLFMGVSAGKPSMAFTGVPMAFPELKDMKCDMCQIVVGTLAQISQNQTSLDALIQSLDKGCDAFFPKDKEKAETCVKVATVVFKLMPTITKELRGLDWTPLAFCAIVMKSCTLDCCDKKNRPEQIRIALGDDPYSMTFVWSTLRPTSTPQVYITADGETTPKVYVGTHRTYTDGGWIGVVYVVKARDLEPGRNYTYQVGSAAGMSDKFTFRMLPLNIGTPGTPLRIAQIGDVDYGEKGKATLVGLQRLAENDGIDVIIHNGDIGYADGYEAHWDVYLRKIQPIASRVPYMVGPGNHEFWFNFTAYKTRFAMPGSTDSMYYSLNLGPNVHIQMLNTENIIDTADIDEHQVNWIKQDLAATNATWKIATSHRPFYCTNKDERQCVSYAKWLRGRAEEALVQGKTDLIITAHMHNYERTYPIYNDEKVSDSYVNTTAPTYVINGAGGNREGERGVKGDKPWSAAHMSTNGYGLIYIEDKHSLTYRFVESATSSVVDEFVLRK